MIRRMVVAGALVVAGVVGAGAPPAGAVSSFEVVNLLFGSSLGDVGVDVCVDGTEVATDLSSGASSGLLSSAGATIELLVALHEDGVACDAKATVFIDETGVAVPEGGAVALFNGANDVGGAQPEYTVLAGPTCVDADQGRVTLFHAANAGPVDVLADGTEVVTGLANGQTESLDVAAGTSWADVEVVPAGGGTPVVSTPFGPVVADQEALVAVVGGVGPSPETQLFGVEVLTRDLPTCPPPTTTTTTVPTTTTSVAPAAVTAAPRFTG